MNETLIRPGRGAGRGPSNGPGNGVDDDFPEGTTVKAPDGNPFPGLRPFHRNEEQYFFGRETQTDGMVDKLAASRFLTVIGSSGSGKSSLVNCGLRVALHGGLMASAGTRWRVAQFRPGSDPIGALARTLAADGVLFDDFESAAMTLDEIVETNLRMSRMGLVDIVQQARTGDDVNVLVVVDQFEELFRYRRRGDNGDSAAFVELLLEARRQAARHRIYIVLTMRSDFLGDCSRYPGLAEAINEGQYLVPQMTREERRLAIEGPVKVCGARMAPVLLTRLVNDLGDDPDQLSVLQHALNRIWSVWAAEGDRSSALNLSHYSAIGSMANALDRHAEKAFAELADNRQQLLAQKMFQALTDKSTDVRGVRRPTPLRTLCAVTGASSAELVEIIEVFRKPSRSFLMPPADEPLEAETVIDISHESLMRKWRRLIGWADDEARSMQTYRRLAETASLHAAGKAGLWRDPDLQIALDWQRESEPTEAWATRYQSGFSEAMQFLDESAAAHEAEMLKDHESTLRKFELEQANALADEQSSRIEAQERMARVQKRDFRIISAALVVSTTLAALAIWQTVSRNHFEGVATDAVADVREAEAEVMVAKTEATEAEAAKNDALAEKKNVVGALLHDRSELEVALDEKKNLVDVLISDRTKLAAESVVSGILRNATTIHAMEKSALADQVAALTSSLRDEEIKDKALWKLIASGNRTSESRPARVSFTNGGSDGVLVLQLTVSGEETTPTLVPAGERSTLVFGVNDVWVARASTGGHVIDADVVDGDGSVSLDAAVDGPAAR